MDLKDKKILYELDQNSRQSFAQIAKKVGLSQETVRYRFNLLINSGKIFALPAVINGSKIGLLYTQVLFKLKNIDLKKKNLFLDNLVKQKHILWVCELEGSYDVGCIIGVKNQIELSEFINEITKELSVFIMRKTISLNLEGEFLDRAYLIGKRKISSSYKSTSEIRIIEPLELSICKELSINSRVSIIELSKKLNQSIDIILYRIKKLEKEGIISGYRLIIDANKTDMSHYKVFITLSTHTKEEKTSLLTFIKLENRAISIVHSLGSWDLEIDLEIDNYTQLDSFLMSLGEKFSPIVRDYEVIRIKSMKKYVFLPE